MTLKKLQISIFLILASITCFSQSKKAWKKIKPDKQGYLICKAGNFKVKFPGKPDYSMKIKKLSSMKVVNHIYTYAENKYSVYMVSVIALPTDQFNYHEKKQIMKMIFSSGHETMAPAKLVSSEIIEENGIYEFRFEYHSKDKDLDGRMNGRAILVGDLIIRVVYSGTKGSGLTDEKQLFPSTFILYNSVQ